MEKRKQTRKKKSALQTADVVLARITDRLKPYESLGRKLSDVFEEIAAEYSTQTGINKSGKYCQDRMRILLRSHRTNERKESPTGSAALPEPTELDELMDEISASELGAKRLSDGEKKKAEAERQYEQQLTQAAI